MFRNALVNNKTLHIATTLCCHTKTVDTVILLFKHPSAFWMVVYSEFQEILLFIAHSAQKECFSELMIFKCAIVPIQLFVNVCSLFWITGNKTDLEKTRHVDAEVAEEWVLIVFFYFY